MAALAGEAWYGIWLSAAVMCASICWMLQGWLPPYWALLGGLLAVMRLGLFGYWMNSYWGGAVAATGGALVLGALPRILRKWRSRDSLILAVGAAVLMFSRPYEGLLLAAPVFLILAVRLFKRMRMRRGKVFLPFATPIAAVLGIAFVAQGYYNWRLTGDAWLMPYQVNRQAYVSAPYFLWESINTNPVYRHEALHNFFVRWQLRHSSEATASITGFVLNTGTAFGIFWMFYLGPALTLPLIMLPRIVRDRRLRLVLVDGAIVTIGIGLMVFFYPHYAAPLTGALYAVLLQGMRHMRFSRACHGRSGLLLASGVPLVCLALVLARIPMQAAARFLPLDHPATWYSTRPGNVARARISTFLQSLPGSHLVLVRYRPEHNVFEEWVYNEADIENARVIWAREMDEAANRDLMRYFKDRRTWVVEADRRPPRLAPYAAAPSAPTGP